MDRRQFLKSTGFTLSATTLGSTAGRAQAAPIKVGVLAPLTGVVASGGREMVEGTQFWFDQNGNQISGRKVELLIEDDASNPDVSLQKARTVAFFSNSQAAAQLQADNDGILRKAVQLTARAVAPLRIRLEHEDCLTSTDEQSATAIRLHRHVGVVGGPIEEHCL